MVSAETNFRQFFKKSKVAYRFTLLKGFWENWLGISKKGVLDNYNHFL